MSGPLPSTVGYGNDLVARVPGLIQRAVGSFDNPVGKVGDGAFSLQLNSNSYLNPLACTTAKDPTRCKGWQQFIFDWPGNGSAAASAAYMQYWLINYNNPCPGFDLGNGLNQWQTSTNPDGTQDCYKNSDGVSPSLPFAVETLNGLVLSGSTKGGKDTVEISIEATGEVIGASGQDSFLDLGPNWQSAEFNAVGYCCSGQAVFGNPMYVNVSLAVDDGTTNAPICGLARAIGIGETTAETNNLTLSRTCCRYGGASPKITFAEGNLPDPPAAICAEVGVQTAVQYVLRQFKRP
jgi:hypothetical protein